MNLMTSCFTEIPNERKNPEEPMQRLETMRRTEEMTMSSRGFYAIFQL